ncbi:MAG TPA: thioesterase family protein [Candidatus Acidoferrales bacterium]|nr:thioesterase family protein [Candidatus Acidoferrales bacterium]
MDRPVSKGANENRAGSSADAAPKEFADTTIRVRYAETDQMGVVYYGNYFTWFEIGRVELWRQIGFEYKKMEIEDDSFLVVAEANCRYKRPARFDDLHNPHAGDGCAAADGAIRVRNHSARNGRDDCDGRNDARGLQSRRADQVPAGKIPQVSAATDREPSRVNDQAQLVKMPRCVAAETFISTGNVNG